MGVGQLSESDAVDALRLPFYSSSHPTGSHGWRNQFDLGNPDQIPLSLPFRKEDIGRFSRKRRLRPGSVLGSRPSTSSYGAILTVDVSWLSPNLPRLPNSGANHAVAQGSGASPIRYN